ncbi:uncharacterized protein LOC128682903 isoform X2 [Plodia interpunctella]|uniref:uncharacterized protein LOC128682903 isoform X2 n=1 Tax=Plodia interpunctella TaxID=58824 RepID=UPI00236767A7|nr:uncharacterized protein LOC128682903 isoform X2 [Plodia interpunctella]
MGDGLKLIKGKRHKSSSSLSGVPLEGRISTRKLDIRASIPELEDQFALAEARCDDLQEKIDLVKVLKKKRKLKKRSATRVNDQMSVIEAPMISVRTQPKKILMVTEVSQQATRHRRFDMAPNPVRGYLDPATVEQRRMIGQMHGYNQMFRPEHEASMSKATEQMRSSPTRAQQVRPDGDVVFPGGNIRKSSRMTSVQINTGAQDAGCGSDVGTAYSDADDIFNQPTVCNVSATGKNTENPRYGISQNVRRRHVPKETIAKDDVKSPRGYRAESSPHLRKNFNSQKQKESAPSIPEERSVVELFNKAQYRGLSPEARPANSSDPQGQWKKGRGPQTNAQSADTNNVSMSPMKKESHSKHPHRVKYRSRRYELPTVASQMKQARAQYYHGTANHTNIPFVVSKSTAPSHNIGVNIQQVLNGLKIQQPLSGIPLTIAHHMGLGHLPTYGHSRTTAIHPRIDNKEMNAIQLGHKLVRLPSYKFNMSFNRLLALYREGDGMVSRFLRAISRPHYFYTSMYNLATHREDHDGATSKGLSGSQEAKQSLTEYAALYREYEYVDKCIKEGNRDPELEQMKVELSKELANREDHIRRVVQEYGTLQGEMDQSALRSSASTSEHPYRHSTNRLNVGEPQL